MHSLETIAGLNSERESYLASAAIAEENRFDSLLRAAQASDSPLQYFVSNLGESDVKTTVHLTAEQFTLVYRLFEKLNDAPCTGKYPPYLHIGEVVPE